MEIQAAISKINRYASLEQGNSVEVIERPNGGISIVMAEGRLENRRSSAVTMKAAHDILALIAEGVHDGASARVVLSRIKNEHHEKASVAVSIISCDLETKTIVITKNSSIPILTCDHAENRTLPINSDPDELRYNPSVYQFELVPGQIFILISEGVFNAGSNSENLIDLNLTLGSLRYGENPPAEIDDLSGHAFMIRRAGEDCRFHFRTRHPRYVLSIDNI